MTTDVDARARECAERGLRALAENAGGNLQFEVSDAADLSAFIAAALTEYGSQLQAKLDATEAAYKRLQAWAESEVEKTCELCDAADLRTKLAAAEARVAEVEAQAGELRGFVEDYARQLRLDGCLTGIFDKAECEKMAQEAEAALNSSTAGRSLLARVKELEGEVAAARKLAWHLIEAAGGRVQISDVQLASVGPCDDCRIESCADARNRCTVFTTTTTD